jgi:hypothetical protein
VNKKENKECVWCGDTKRRLNPKTLAVEECAACFKHLPKESTAAVINSLAITAKPISRDSINENTFNQKYADQVRHGKTKKDKESGSHNARFANRQARVDWQHDPRRTAETFPSTGRN